MLFQFLWRNTVAKSEAKPILIMRSQNINPVMKVFWNSWQKVIVFTVARHVFFLSKRYPSSVLGTILLIAAHKRSSRVYFGWALCCPILLIPCKGIAKEITCIKKHIFQAVYLVKAVVLQKRLRARLQCASYSRKPSNVTNIADELIFFNH